VQKREDKLKSFASRSQLSSCAEESNSQLEVCWWRWAGFSL